MLFDTHAHIYDESLLLEIDQVIKNCLSNQVKLIMVPGDNLINSLKCIDLANKYDFIYAAVGVHPEEINNLNLSSTILELEQLVLKNPKIKAIGEIGLDYYYRKDNASQQKEWFRKQIELANKMHLPIIVHSREACQDTFDLLQEIKPLYGCVIHCFSYSVEVMLETIKRGYYIGLDGPVTYKNALTPKEVAKKVPLEKLLLETDSPFLAPVPNRGKKNDPSNLIYIAQTIAELKQISYDELTNITYENGKRFFSI